MPTAIMASNSNNQNTNVSQARPSRRVQDGDLQADGDTWQETLAVCESPTTKLMIRSFYQNVRSGKRVWDEPPSGASHVRPASEEMRRMAQIQLQEMQLVTRAVVDDDFVEPSSNNDSNKTEAPTKKRGLFGFRRSKKKNNKGAANDKRVIQYKEGSMMRSGKKSSNSRSDGGGQNDIEMQEAIARSIAESQGKPYDAGHNVHASSLDEKREDEDEALAMALSLSEAEAKANGVAIPPSYSNNDDDDDNVVRTGDLLGGMNLDAKPAAKKAPMQAASNLKAPPSYSTNPPPVVAAAAATKQGPPATPNYASHARTVLTASTPPPASPTKPSKAAYKTNGDVPNSPSQNAYFDPYHKDAAPTRPAPTGQLKRAPQQQQQQQQQQINPSSAASFSSPNSGGHRKLLQLPGLGNGGNSRRSSRQSKMQEKAGLV